MSSLRETRRRSLLSIMPALVTVLSALVTPALSAVGETRSAGTVTPAELGVCYGGLGTNGDGDLITIDVDTGAGTLVGPTGLGLVSGLAIDPTDRLIYGVDLAGDLYMIDSETAAPSLAASTGQSHSALAFDGDGNLYSHGFSKLYSIDKSTGSLTEIGVSARHFGGMAFDPTTGTLYGTTGGGSPSELHAINTETGASSLVGATGLSTPVSAIHFDPAGNLSGAAGGGNQPNDFVTLDKSTGAATVVGSIGFVAVSGMDLFES